jgi:hypothetical protein
VAASYADPGTLAPWEVKASPSLPANRSAMVSTASAASTRMVPCRNSVGASTTTARAAVLALGRSAASTTATKAATRPVRVSVTWVT